MNAYTSHLQPLTVHLLFKKKKKLDAPRECEEQSTEGDDVSDQRNAPFTPSGFISLGETHLRAQSPPVRWRRCISSSSIAVCVLTHVDVRVGFVIFPSVASLPLLLTDSIQSVGKSKQPLA